MRVFLDPAGVSRSASELRRLSDEAERIATRAIRSGFVGAPPSVMAEAVSTCTQVRVGTAASRVRVGSRTADLDRRVQLSGAGGNSLRGGPGIPSLAAIMAGTPGLAKMLRGAGVVAPMSMANRVADGIGKFWVAGVGSDGKARIGFYANPTSKPIKFLGTSTTFSSETLIGAEGEAKGPSWGWDKKDWKSDGGWHAELITLSGFAGIRQAIESKTTAGPVTSTTRGEVSQGVHGDLKAGIWGNKDGGKASVKVGAGIEREAKVSQELSVRQGSVKGEAGVSAGLAASGEAKAEVSTKEIKVKLKVKVVLGIGGSLGGEVSVKPEEIARDVGQGLDHVNRAAQDAGRAVNHAVGDAGKAVNNAVSDAGRGIDNAIRSFKPPW
jgi:hypothetical protein